MIVAYFFEALGRNEITNLDEVLEGFVSSNSNSESQTVEINDKLLESALIRLGNIKRIAKAFMEIRNSGSTQIIEAVRFFGTVGVGVNIFWFLYNNIVPVLSNTEINTEFVSENITEGVACTIIWFLANEIQKRNYNNRIGRRIKGAFSGSNMN